MCIIACALTLEGKKKYSQAHQSLHILHVDVLQRNIGVIVRVRLKVSRVYDAVVKDWTITFGAWPHSFRRLVAEAFVKK